MQGAFAHKLQQACENARNNIEGELSEEELQDDVPKYDFFGDEHLMVLMKATTVNRMKLSVASRNIKRCLPSIGLKKTS
jgi:hypothetical protein